MKSGRVLSKVIVCPTCGGNLRFDDVGLRTCCLSEKGSVQKDGMIIYDPALSSKANSEMSVRDAQAKGYLAHSKFPIQIYRIKEFVRSASRSGLPILDLGCGPGPSTELLLAAGFPVIGVDFSLQSLLLNSCRCAGFSEKLFIHADLTRVRFIDQSVGGLMMADFLQHLDGAESRKSFLSHIFGALAPGGWFFLSFFNVNIKHRLKRDIDGSYAGGKIKYHRATAREVIQMLPADVKITKVMPMNVFHQVQADRLASALPFASHLSRMMVICGLKS